MERPVEKVWLVYNPHGPVVPGPSLLVVAETESGAVSYWDLPTAAVAEEIDYEDIFIDVNRKSKLKSGVLAKLNIGDELLCSPSLSAEHDFIRGSASGDCEYGMPYHNTAVL